MVELVQKIKSKLKVSSFYLFYSKFLKLLYYIFGIAGRDIIQLANTTKSNRHPDLFTFCQILKGKESKLKILSYGCSSGEECFSLREYFPNSLIIGCDINNLALKKARKINVDTYIEFIYSNERNLKLKGEYDLIFILSVLCKEPEARLVDDISNFFSFKQFNLTISLLDENLRKGGLIIIRNANYLIEDCDIMNRYSCLYKSETGFPIFNKNGLKIRDAQDCCQIVIKNH
jgi:hypothetical protein